MNSDRVFVKVGDRMVNVDHIVYYTNERRTDSDDMDLVVWSTTCMHIERGTTMEEFTERLVESNHLG